MVDLEKATESLLGAKNELKTKLSELDAVADLQKENERLVGKIKTKNTEISSVQSELSSCKGEVKALKDEMKSSRDELVKKTREAERYSSVAEGADAVRDQLAKKDDEIAGLEQKIGVSELTLEEMKKSIMEKEQETEATNEKLLAAESEMAELKGRLEELNIENMKLINDIADALNAAGNSQEANAVKKKAEAAQGTAAQKENRRGLGGFIRRMSGDFDDDAIEDMIKEKEDEPLVNDLDDAIHQLKEKNARIKELEEAAEQHEEALLTLKSDLVRLNASYKDDDYLNKKNIEKLRQENTMYAMQLQRMEQELAEYREMYQ
jgi:chromosome segregation ATPase